MQGLRGQRPCTFCTDGTVNSTGESMASGLLSIQQPAAASIRWTAITSIGATSTTTLCARGPAKPPDAASSAARNVAVHPAG